MNVQSKNPFEGLEIDSHELLHNVTARTKCPGCSSSRKYFCYQCHVPMQDIAGKFQTVKLPLKVDIIKHQLELDGKSTAVHARLLAPDQVTIYTYPNVPQYANKEKVLLVFPFKDAVSLEDLMKQHRTSTERNGAEQKRPQRKLGSDQSGNHQEINPNNTGVPTSSSLEPDSTKASSTNPSKRPCCSSQGRPTSSGDLISLTSEFMKENHSLVKGQTLINPEMGPQALDHFAPSKQVDDQCSCHSESNNALSKVPCTQTLTSEVHAQEAIAPENRMEKKELDVSEAGFYERVVFIDSTWQQSGVISRDERLEGFKRVVIEDRKTTFWRKQHRKPQSFLATIEAIYYFMIDYHRIVLGRVYRGQYDNLLFFYSFMYHLVQKTAEERETLQEGET